MPWDFEISPAALKQLTAIGSSAVDQIISFLEKRIRGSADPTAFGKALRGDLKGFWRYRVQDCRILCRIEHHHVVVLVVAARPPFDRLRGLSPQPRF